MTRAQQTISIGLLVTSVRKPLLYSKLHNYKFSPAPWHKLTECTALSCALSGTHPTSKPYFKRNNTSRTLCLPKATPSILLERKHLLLLLQFLPTLQRLAVLSPQTFLSVPSFDLRC